MEIYKNYIVQVIDVAHVPCNESVTISLVFYYMIEWLLKYVIICIWILWMK